MYVHLTLPFVIDISEDVFTYELWRSGLELSAHAYSARKKPVSDVLSLTENRWGKVLRLSMLEEGWSIMMIVFGVDVDDTYYVYLHKW